jgi:hypothetical protein
MRGDKLNKSMSESDMQEAIQRILDRINEINDLYIDKIATQIKKIGELNQSSINRMLILADMGADIAEINLKLQTATNLNLKEIFKIYQQALDDTYTDPRFKEYMTENPLPAESKERLNRFVRNVSVQTAKTMYNLSNTTAISQTYQETVDKAIVAVSSGVDDYKTAMRASIRNLGYNGMQVQYESGYHRRLDTAIRQNIIDGTNQIAQNASMIIGQELGYDAVEISAHLRSAPDHEPVQGRVFLLEEYHKMQDGRDFVDISGHRYSGFKRPIGEWNCMHFAMSFSTQHSVRKYTDKQLREWKELNNKGCTIDGKHYTTYQAVQLMRKIETQVRREKDTAVAARKANDKELQKECQQRINALSAKYGKVAQAAGITPRRDRLSVEGFRAIKVG